MPGIVGLITKMPSERAKSKLMQMLATTRHETFYKTGTWIDESLGVYIGWTLKENSFCEGMPIRNDRAKLTMVFSGEEFSNPALANSFQDDGNCARSAYLVQVAEEQADFPATLNGRFHGLLVDHARSSAILFNDRYGMHRLYYHEASDAFYFAAEAKAILKVCPTLRTVDERSLGELVSCGCVLENRTLFPEIHVLPSGSSWELRDGQVARKASYFSPKEWEDQAPLDSEAYYNELRDVFARILPRYFNGQERIAVSLTGGLDTRIIMAWRKAGPNTLPCYTYGGAFRECYDVRVARRIATLCGQKHQVIPVGDEFLSNFANYAERSIYLTDGCVDMSRTPDLFVSEKARTIAPIRMVGTFGSEILQQVATFKPRRPSPDLFRPEFLSYVDQAETTYGGIRTQNPLTFSAFRQSGWWHYGIVALEQSQITERCPYLDNEFVRTVFRAPKGGRETTDVRLRLVRDGDAKLAKIPTDRGIGGASGPFTGFIRRAFLEFTFKAEYAYDYGMPQWLAQLDHTLSGLQLERAFLGRHKLFHFRLWYRDALAKYVREMLLDERTLSRPYLQRKGVEEIVNGHLKGNRNYTTDIHKLLTVELVHRLLVDSH